MPPINRVILSGNEAFLKAAIAKELADYQKLKNLQVEGSGGYGNTSKLSPKFKGKIQIKLVFTGKSATGKFKQSAKSFRLMSENPSTFSDNRIQYYSQRVYSKFKNFSFKLGKISCNYSDWDKGYQLQQIYVSSIDEGRRVVEQILDIQGHSLDLDLFRYNIAPNSNSAFPEIPEKVIIAGIPIRTEQRRPLGEVTFSEALIHLPHTKNYELLCDNSGYLLKSTAFLRSLET